jgi:hypothetical protein
MWWLFFLPELASGFGLLLKIVVVVGVFLILHHYALEFLRAWI